MVSKESSINKMLIVILYALLFSVTYLLLFSFGGKNASAALSLSGSGTYSNPYKISSPADLKKFRDYVNNGNTMSGQYIELTCDIDMNNEPFICIGYTRTGNNSKDYSFNGIFDGKNHVLQNLTLQSSTGDQYSSFPNGGLFANTDGATIKNLMLSNVSANDFGWFCGALVGDANNTTIENVIVLSGSINNPTAIGDYATGGIVGYAHDGTSINLCKNYASVSCETSGYRAVAGGIVGAIGAKLNGVGDPIYSSASISKCGNFGSVVANSITLYDAYAGGVAGYAGCNIENCFNQGTINSNSNNNSVKNTAYAGGIVGYSNSTCVNCYNTGAVSGGYVFEEKSDSYVIKSGFLGIGQKTAKISLIYSTKTKTSSINGYIDATVTNCYSTYSVSKKPLFLLTLKENDTVCFNNHNCSSSKTYTFSNDYYFKSAALADPDYRHRQPTYSLMITIYSDSSQSTAKKSFVYTQQPLNKNGTELPSSSLQSDLPSGFSSDVWAIYTSIDNGYPHFKGKYWVDYSETPDA